MKIRIAIAVIAALGAALLFFNYVLNDFGAKSRYELVEAPVAKFLEGHWGGVPRSSSAAGGWSSEPDSLLPESCGRCHELQHFEWRGSRHAAGMGPGVLVQLIADEAGMDSCNRCHAPLLEQRGAPKGIAGNPLFDPILRGTGLSCVACHLRDGKIYGPPPLGEKRKYGEGDPAHGAFKASAAFESSLFCANCHQFGPDEFALNGKPLENTYVEWRESPQAKLGLRCQSCHMPGRRHLWRGIHDPGMTAAGLELRLSRKDERGVRAVLESVEIGHLFPTYVTPRATLVLDALDAKGRTLRREEFVIQRFIDIYLEAEHFDTRLAPGDSVLLELNWGAGEAVVAVEAFLYVEPDEFYDRFFAVYRPVDDEGARRLGEVIAEIRAGTYTILERELTID